MSDADAPLTVEEVAPGITRIALPLTGLPSGVNVHLLRGDGPTTLIDAAIPTEGSWRGLEAGLAAVGAAPTDVEQVVLTHHHVDHVGLAGRLGELGARIVAQPPVAEALADPRGFHERELDWGERHVARHAAPVEILGSPRAAVRMLDGFRPWSDVAEIVEGDVVPAGDLRLRVLARPGHSPTDTLLVDEERGIAAVGDHLFATAPLTPVLGSMVDPRGRPAADYLRAIEETAARGERLLLTGHGPALDDPAATIADRRAALDRRTARIRAALSPEPTTAWDLGLRVWPGGTPGLHGLTRLAAVLASLELLEDRGVVRRGDDPQRVTWSLAEAAGA